MKDRQYSKNLLQDSALHFAVELMEQKKTFDKKIAHYHDHYEILYVYKGARILTADDRDALLDESHIALLPPYCFHQTTSVGDAFHKRILINFSNQFIEHINKACNYQLLSCFYLPNHVAEVSPGSLKTVQSLFQKLLYTNNQPCSEYTNTENLLIMAQLLSLLSKETTNVHEAPDKTIYRAYYAKIIDVTKFIEENHTKEISLGELAARFKIDKFQLSRAFKEIMGISFVAYINNIRINHAQLMLLENNVKITTIAYACGFESTTHFERVFKRVTGTTPSQFRTYNKIIS